MRSDDCLEKALRKTVLLMMSADLPLAIMGTRTSSSISSWYSCEIIAVTTLAIDCLAFSCIFRSYSSTSTLLSRPRCFFSAYALLRKVKRLEVKLIFLGLISNYSVSGVGMAASSLLGSMSKSQKNLLFILIPPFFLSFMAYSVSRPLS